MVGNLRRRARARGVSGHRADRAVRRCAAASFHITASGVAWFVAAALLFTVFMYGVAETLAARIAKQEEYIGATPAVAILPFFFAGALFPIARCRAH